MQSTGIKQIEDLLFSSSSAISDKQIKDVLLSAAVQMEAVLKQEKELGNKPRRYASDSYAKCHPAAARQSTTLYMHAQVTATNTRKS